MMPTDRCGRASRLLTGGGRMVPVEDSDEADDESSDSATGDMPLSRGAS